MLCYTFVPLFLLIFPYNSSTSFWALFILILTLLCSFLSANFGCWFKRPTFFIILSLICFSCSNEPVRIFNPTLTLVKRDWHWMATLANTKTTNNLKIEILILSQKKMGILLCLVLRGYTLSCNLVIESMPAVNFMASGVTYFFDSTIMRLAQYF